MNDVAVIIVSYNTRDHLNRCLHSLHAAGTQCTHEVVVVDNGSSDGSVGLVRTHWPDVRLIEIGENVGFAAANNRGAEATDSAFVLLLNSDTEVPPGAVDGLMQPLRDDPDISVVGPRLVDRAGQVELSHGSMMSPWGEVWQKLKGLVLARQIPGLASWVARSMTRPHFPDWVSGACLLVRRADAEAAGWFDERFFLYAEDVDLCASIRRLGHRILFTPAVEVVHHGGRSGLHDQDATHTFYRRSQLAFYEKHHPAWVPVLRLYLRVKGALPDRLL